MKYLVNVTWRDDNADTVDKSINVDTVAEAEAIISEYFAKYKKDIDADHFDAAIYIIDENQRVIDIVKSYQEEDGELVPFFVNKSWSHDPVDSKVLHLQINGESEICNVVSAEDFPKLFNYLHVSPFMDDDREYWILYEEDESWDAGVFWACPVDKIRLAYSSDMGWTILEDSEEVLIMSEEICEDEYEEDQAPFVDVEDLDEESETSEAYKQALNNYNVFEKQFQYFLLHDKRANADTLKFWQNLQKWVGTPTDSDVRDDNKYCFITWTEAYWRAWLYSIICGTYNYMNLTNIVWDSWEHV